MLALNNIKTIARSYQYPLLMVSGIAIFLYDFLFLSYAYFAVCFLALDYEFKVSQEKTKWPFLFLMLYVLWGYFTLFYTENMRVEGYATYASLLAVPLLLAALSGLFVHKRHVRMEKVENAYLWGAFFFLLGTAGMFIYHYYYGVNQGRISVYGSGQVFKLLIHRTFVSAMLTMSFPFLFKRLFFYPPKAALISALFISIIVLSIFLSGAKTSLFVALLVSLILCSYYGVQRFSKHFLWIALSCGLLFMGVMLTSSSRVREFLWFHKQGVETSSSEYRLIAWETALELIKERPLLGVGAGDSQDELNRRYNENNKSIYLGTNAHNQYLQTWLERGLVGLFFLVAFFVSLVFCTDKRLRIYAITFALVYGLTFMVESMLLRHIAVFPMAFWLFAFATVRADEKIEEISTFAGKTDLWRGVILALVFLFVIFLLKKTIEFDSRNPRTYMAVDYKHVTYEELPDKEHLPSQTDACLIDKTNLKLFRQFQVVNFYKIKNEEADSITFDVWCYVSRDCNLTGANAFIYNKELINSSHFYDLSQKGTWQCLSLKHSEVSKYSTLGMRLDLKNAKTMEGYVIFALPEIKFLNK